MITYPVKLSGFGEALILRCFFSRLDTRIEGR